MTTLYIPGHVFSIDLLQLYSCIQGSRSDVDLDVDLCEVRARRVGWDTFYISHIIHPHLSVELDARLEIHYTLHPPQASHVYLAPKDTHNFEEPFGRSVELTRTS
jgi:hypothetical protein